MSLWAEAVFLVNTVDVQLEHAHSLNCMHWCQGLKSCWAQSIISQGPGKSKGQCALLFRTDLIYTKIYIKLQNTAIYNLTLSILHKKMYAAATLLKLFHSNLLKERNKHIIN